MSSKDCPRLFPLLSDYIDGELDLDDFQRIVRHVAACGCCRALLAELQAAVEACRHFRPSQLEPQVAARLRAVLLEDLWRARCKPRPRAAPLSG